MTEARRRVVAMAAFAPLALICAAVAVVMLKGHGAVAGGLDHTALRTQAIALQASQAKFDIVVLGDSTTEFAELPDLCGRRTLNAGLAGASLASMPAVLDSVRATAPSTIIIAIGLNDARRGRSTAGFRGAYERLVANAMTAAPKVVLVGPSPIDSKDGRMADGFDPATVAAIGGIVADVGRSKGLPVANLGGLGSELPLALTVDGVHLNAAGYRVWRGAVEAAAC